MALNLSSYFTLVNNTDTALAPNFKRKLQFELLLLRSYQKRERESSCGSELVYLPSVMYAYDAYFLDCALRYAIPLLTLDKGLKLAAKEVGVRIMEV